MERLKGAVRGVGIAVLAIVGIVVISLIVTGAAALIIFTVEKNFWLGALAWAGIIIIFAAIWGAIFWSEA